MKVTLSTKDGVTDYAMVERASNGYLTLLTWAEGEESLSPPTLLVHGTDDMFRELRDAIDEILSEAK